MVEVLLCWLTFWQQGFGTTNSVPPFFPRSRFPLSFLSLAVPPLLHLFLPPLFNMIVGVALAIALAVAAGCDCGWL